MAADDPLTLRARTWEEEAKDGSSYCRIYRNIWIGNVGAALRVSKGVITEFKGVFNASSSECAGVSYEDGHLKRGVTYDTLMDDDTGVTLADMGTLPWSTTEAIASAIANSLMPDPQIKRLGGKKVIYAQQVPFATKATFLYLMARAAEKIDKILVTIGPKNQLLVHCMAGQNRSVSAVVAYLTVVEGMEPTKAIYLCRKAIREIRRTEALTNPLYADALLTLHREAGDTLGLRETFVKEYNEIIELADVMSPVEGTPTPPRPVAACAACGRSVSATFQEEDTGRCYCSDRCLKAVSC
jgi:hypothetical protein